MGRRRLAVLAGLTAAVAALGARMARSGRSRHDDGPRAGEPPDDGLVPEEEVLHEGHPHFEGGEDRGHS